MNMSRDIHGTREELVAFIIKQRTKIVRLRTLMICIELDFDASPSVRALARRALKDTKS